jgi:hypothetical protein
LKYIFLVLFLSFALGAQTNNYSTSEEEINSKTEKSDAKSNLTQADIRSQRRWEIGGIGATGIASLRVEYNLTSKFSLGYSHFHYKDILWKAQINPYPGFASLRSVEEQFTAEVGRLNARYYLWELFPLYITGGIGRNFIGGKIKTYQYGNLYPDGSFSPHPVVIDKTFSPYNFLFAGLGFQWVFKNGVFIGLESFLVKSLNHRTKTSYTILDTNYSQTQLLLNLLNTDEKEISGNFMLQDFWFGYAFSF